MKKLSYFGGMLLFAAMTYSCASDDKAITEPYTTIQLNGYKYKTDLLATFQGQVGEEVSIGFGVYDNFDICGVDFGDGIIVTDSVGNQNGGIKGDDGKTKVGTTHTSTTTFKGTVARDGIVKVYGKSDIWYLNISGKLMPTSFDQPKLANVVQISISGATAESVELPALPALTQFSFGNSPIKKLDISKVPTLTSLSIINTSTSEFEPALASIDLSQNPNLEQIIIGGEYYKKGILASLDISKNPALTNVAVGNNDIETIKMADSYAKLTTFNAAKNKLTAFDVAKVPAIKSLYLASNQLTTVGDVSSLEALAWFDVQDNKLTGDMELKSTKLTNVYVNKNELTSIKVPNVTKQFYFDNNKMTFATMPALPEGMNTTSKKKQFHYQPQADMEVAPEGSVLDLSAQATAKGIEAEPQATTFALTAGDAILMEGKDYTVKDGKITFITDQKDVLVKMNNPGYPDLYLHTKPFDVKGAGVPAEPDAAVYVAEGVSYTSGQTVTDGVVSLTFGENGGADFNAGVANAQVEGYTAYTSGNGTNGNKAGGTFYTIKSTQAGKVEIAVVLNADKKFYIEEDGTALADFNGITVAEKYFGTYSFPVKAGSSYKIYCAGSKLGFYGFKFFK